MYLKKVLNLNTYQANIVFLKNLTQKPLKMQIETKKQTYPRLFINNQTNNLSSKYIRTNNHKTPIPTIQTSTFSNVLHYKSSTCNFTNYQNTPNLSER